MDDLDLNVAPPILARLAGAASFLAGICLLASAAQLVVFSAGPWYYAFAALQALFGAIAAVVGMFQFQGEAWAAIVGVIGGVFTWLLLIVWTIYLMTSGVLAVLPLMASAFCGGAGVLSAFSIPGSLRVGRARAQLFAGR